MAQNGKRNHAVALAPSAMPRTPHGIAAMKTAPPVTGKRMHWPVAVVNRTSSAWPQICASTIPLCRQSEPHRDFASAIGLGRNRSLLRPHAAARGREHDIERVPRRLVFRQWHDRGDPLAWSSGNMSDQRLSPRVRRRKRQPPDFFLSRPTARGKEQRTAWRRGDKQPRDRNPRRASAFPHGPCRRVFARDRRQAAEPF